MYFSALYYIDYVNVAESSWAMGLHYSQNTVVKMEI